MKINNPAIGEIEVDDGGVIEFPEGMLGLPQFKHYVIVSDPQMQPFLRLQCVDEPQISFLTIDPAFAISDYKDYVVAQDPWHVLFDREEEVVLLVVCTVSPDRSDITCNLQAPVVINHKTMKGNQIVLIDSPYAIRHSLVKNAEQQGA
ncbi:MAG TPA: flagellar assembly protein FliW [Acidobacteriota bacterium]|nr:flagellar assembly protein FliW [Acidobacteriota bacterium]